MVVVRLTRLGRKKRAFFRIVAMDSRKKRDGSALDILGYYDPLKTEDKVKLDLEKYNAWVQKGAIPTPAVENLVKSLKR
ncbi:MAG: 30S ribosomal protein S16 [Desulfurella sp.]|uniref:30S ribosomal protein S16 n=1 Tax=Desulfurella TaxID=33001 RepID=UPI0003E08A42|nr:MULTISPECIES: 30S ribosomal protein S16 [Desulfurella]AHF97626.1 30S ribosomal protein S16 [Desulfurella acetivorans A63]PMP63788.1 MAG: 30S ribosomal protein S16 [Desulfurella multipotens]PMP88254.1 MAG: 30S ribosomal protein S16 [Desulfurella sp.]HEX13025.1 30S ribosomal protein S16 [Desulfurella acetivorans]